MSYISHISQDNENFIIKIGNIGVSEEEISVMPKENSIDVKIADENLHFDSPKIDMNSTITELRDKILTIKAKILKGKEKDKGNTNGTNIEMLQKEIIEKDREIEKLNNMYNMCLREVADLDNARKIWEKKEKEIREYGAKDVMINLLPLLDTYDSAYAAYKDRNLSDDAQEMLEGVKKIYERLVAILKEQGLAEILCLGTKFDPFYHEAIMWEETDKFPDGIIIEEFQKGYVYKGILLRSSKVKVAKGEDKNSENKNLKNSRYLKWVKK